MPDKQEKTQLLHRMIITKAEAPAGEDRVLAFVGSTACEDRHEESIDQRGWKLENYKKNPIFLWAHDYSSPPIGKALDVRVEDDQLLFKIQFATAAEYPFADTIYNLYKGGYLHATSVGFIPLAWIDDTTEEDSQGYPKRTFIKQELLELSAVPVPSNPEALALAKAAGVITTRELAKVKRAMQQAAPEAQADKGPKDVSQKELGDELDYVLGIVDKAGIAQANTAAAVQLTNKIQEKMGSSLVVMTKDDALALSKGRLTGGDTPADITTPENKNKSIQEETAMPLTDEQKQEINTAVKDSITAATGEIVTAIKDQLLADKSADRTPAGRKVNPGGQVTVVEDEDDKITKDPKGGFNRFGEFCVHVAHSSTRGMTPQLRRWQNAYQRRFSEAEGAEAKTAGYLEEGDGAQGGYAVPTGFVAEIQTKALEEQIVRPRAVPIPMATNSVEIPVTRDSTHASGTYYGITFYRPGETVQRTASNPKMGKIKLNLHNIDGLVHVTNALLEDSPVSIVAWLERCFPPALGAVQDDDFLLGDGVNKALGAFNTANPCIVTQDAETAQVATTIVAKNIIKMWSRLPQRNQRNAVWVANNDTFPQLAAMTITVGTGGIAVYMPANGLANAPYGTLMGRPLILSEKMQTLGTAGDIGLADFSEYYIGEKSGGIQFATSMHLRFDYNEQSFRFSLRYDGQPALLEALTPRRSSATLSPFVVLATRS